jgi:hypothetical protein
MILPLSMRKTNLQRLLARRPEGVFIDPIEHGEIGPDLFRAASATIRSRKSLVISMISPQSALQAPPAILSHR